MITAERAEAYLAEQTGTGGATGGGVSNAIPPSSPAATVPSDLFTEAPATTGVKSVAGFTWSGDVPHQKWMNFYTKVLSRFATGGGLKLTVAIEVTPPGGTTVSKAEETKVALRELGMAENVVLRSKDRG